ncbi:hypothetical protein MVEN_01451700 [Mycena venus]|uniref:Uncharacterized protein n=1 Tax=Mycena venus TaxID=2733690 RepID=A0A8H6XT31_9AGAR|nr:hypothetical protein MVEN_01451700 [Mycena venus]
MCDHRGSDCSRGILYKYQWRSAFSPHAHSMPTKANVAALLLSSFVHVSAQTLYTVSAGTFFNPWANATISVSAIGTGSDGGTTYVEVATARPSVFVTTSLLGAPESTPFTVDVEPFTQTFVEDASGWRASGVAFGGSDAVTCSFGTAGRGTCVESVPFGTTTIIATYSGSVVPFYTLAASTPTKSFSFTPSRTAPSSAPSSAPSTTAPPNATVQNAAFSFYGAVFLVLGLLFHFL